MVGTVVRRDFTAFGDGQQGPYLHLAGIRITCEWCEFVPAGRRLAPEGVKIGEHGVAALIDEVARRVSRQVPTAALFDASSNHLARVTASIAEIYSTALRWLRQFHGLAVHLQTLSRSHALFNPGVGGHSGGEEPAHQAKPIAPVVDLC